MKSNLPYKPLCVNLNWVAASWASPNEAMPQCSVLSWQVSIRPQPIPWQRGPGLRDLLQPSPKSTADALILQKRVILRGAFCFRQLGASSLWRQSQTSYKWSNSKGTWSSGVRNDRGWCPRALLALAGGNVSTCSGILWWSDLNG